MPSLIALTLLAALPGPRLGAVADPSGTSTAALYFATALGVAGDELLVGRPGRAVRPGAPAGGVHRFRRTPAGTWAETGMLAVPGSAEEDEFGAALAIATTPSGGWQLAVGAPRAQAGRGKVYVFERATRGSWQLRATIAAAVRAPGERFGAALAFRGRTLLVGAPGADNERGRAVLLRQQPNVTRWREIATLTSTDTSHRRFGLVLTLSADRAVVAAPGATYLTRDPRGAAVFVFRDSAGRWVPEARLADPDSATAPDWQRYRFGAALLAEGAGLWIGSPGAANDNGAVLHYQRGPAGEWLLQDRLTPRGAEGGNFGAALTRVGEELVVGAPRANQELGALYVFRPDTGVAAPWREAQRLGLADSATRYRRYGQRGPHLGEVLAGGADVLLAGLPAADNFEGTAVVFERGGASPETGMGANGGAVGRWQRQTLLVDTAWTTRRTLSDVPCRRGRAALFDCRNIDLLAFLPIQAIGGGHPGELTMVNMVWGWTDSATAREFVIVGRSDGAAFVELTDPRRPVYLGELPRNAGTKPAEIREIKVYNQHAFISGEGGGGLQIFDLTQLRDVRRPPVTFQETAHYDSLPMTHTLAANEATGFLYATGGQTCGAGIHMIDVRTPTRPVFAGCFTGHGGIHETHCAVYHGPDVRYRDRELCFDASGGALRIVDVTDKPHSRDVSAALYPNVAFAHQGWLSADHRYFFLGDEFDEFRAARAELAERATIERTRTRTIVLDLRDLEDPTVATEFYGTTSATDHNLYVRGRYLFQANYRAGLRVLDVLDPMHPKEVGYFDTDPAEENIPDFGGAWTNYPYFRSGVIAVASINEGLFLLRFREARSGGSLP